MLLFHLDVLGKMCGENSCNVFLPFFMVLWGPVFATLCMRAVLMMWDAFLFLVLKPLRLPPPCSFLLGVFQRLSCKNDLFFKDKKEINM
jgi:hypothetical protein